MEHDLFRERREAFPEEVLLMLIAPAIRYQHREEVRKKVPFWDNHTCKGLGREHDNLKMWKQINVAEVHKGKGVQNKAGPIGR